MLPMYLYWLPPCSLLHCKNIQGDQWASYEISLSGTKSTLFLDKWKDLAAAQRRHLRYVKEAEHGGGHTKPLQQDWKPNCCLIPCLNAGGP